VPVQSVRPPGKHLVGNRRRVVFVFACCAEPEPELEPEPETVKKPGTGTGTTMKFEWFRIPATNRPLSKVIKIVLMFSGLNGDFAFAISTFQKCD